MLKSFRDIMIVLLCLSSFLWLLNNDLSSNVVAQVSARTFSWSHALSVTTTKIDSIFDKRWENVSITAFGGNAQVKIGAPDTTNFSSRDWITIRDGQSMHFGPSTKLKRLWIKSSSGTITFQMVGYKRSSQF